MDYIILNNDGSLNKSSLNRYIQQGNHGVDKIFIGWANGLAADIAQAVFTLPNQTTNTELGTFEEDYAYDGEHTINGWVFTLTNAQTLYNGALMVSVRIIRNGVVQVAYPFALVINETGVRPEDDSGVTIAQLDSYLLNLQNLVVGQVQANTDAALSPTSENPVQNKVITNALETLKRGSYTKVDTTEYPTLADFLATTGEEGYLYLYPLDVNDEDEGYYQYIWENNQWIPLGTTKIDIANMMTTDTAQSVSGPKTFAGGVIISSSFSSQGHLPQTTETYDLGSNEKKWDKIYLRTIHTAGGNLSLSVGSNIEIYCNQNAYLFPNQDGYLYLGKSNKRFSCVYASSIANDFSAFQIRGKGGVSFQCDNGSAVRPSTNEQLSLGEPTSRWNYVYTKNISNGTRSVAVADIVSKVDTNDIIDLGTFDANGEITIAIDDLGHALDALNYDRELHGMYMLTYLYAQAVIYLDETQIATAAAAGHPVRAPMPVVYDAINSYSVPGNVRVKKVGTDYVFKVSSGYQNAAQGQHLYLIPTDLIK